MIPIMVRPLRLCFHVGDGGIDVIESRSSCARAASKPNRDRDTCLDNLLERATKTFPSRKRSLRAREKCRVIGYNVLDPEFPIMDRPRRYSRQYNGITVRRLSQPTLQQNQYLADLCVSANVRVTPNSDRSPTHEFTGPRLCHHSVLSRASRTAPSSGTVRSATWLSRSAGGGANEK